MTTVEQFWLPGYRCRDHVLRVPLDHRSPDGERIEVFAREVVRPDKAGEDLPWLLYLQGGPGHRSERPGHAHAWLPRALEDYRVLLLDSRGTGRSSVVNAQTLPARGSAEDQAAYLGHFRADAIVADAECFRRELLGDDASWSLLGQSFGGFCALTYLSFAPERLREVMIAGGLPGLHATAADVYRAAYPRVRAKNQAYYERYPADVARVRRVRDVLRAQVVLLPTGERLSAERFLTVGLALGMKSRFDQLHFLLEHALLPVSAPGGDVLYDGFLREVEARTSLGGQELFALLHEPIYGQGAATGWAAGRVRDELPDFDPDRSDGPVLFTGEMIFPWQFEQDPALAPLREVADLLARRTDWPALYDPDRLAANRVPVAAAIYHDDMYVDREMSRETAARLGSCRVWVTDEHEHDGLRDGALDRLVTLVRGLA